MSPSAPPLRRPRALSVLARDLRHTARSLRRTPGFGATLLLTLALGAGLSLPLLALVQAGTEHPAPVEAPTGLDLPLRDAGVASASWDPEENEDPGRLLGNPPSASREGALSIAGEQAAGLRVLLWTVGAAAALALAIACGNLALLLLSRGAARGHEIAMRAALGATPRRLAGQLLAEGGAVAGVGLGLGALLGMAGIALLWQSWPEGLARWLGPAPGAGAAALAFVPLLACALLSGFAPLRGLRHGLHALVSGGTRATTGPREGIARDRLSVAATATSFVLLAGAAFLLRGYGAAPAAAGPGFDPRDTLALAVAAPEGRLADPGLRSAHFAAMLEDVRKVPGVRAASLASEGAWLGLGSTDLASSVTGNPARPGIMRPTRYAAVSPGYFAAFGVPVKSGREFTAGDRPGAPAVAVVSENFAYRFFPRLDPVGKLVQPGRISLDGRWYTVVGVVGDVRPRGLGNSAEPEPVLYLSALQVPPASAGIAVRAAGDPRDLVPAVERAIARAGPGPEVTVLGTMEEQLARFRAPLRWFALVFGALAAFSVLLAASGLYGVIAYNVARRTREIGVRGAIGAAPGALVRMVVREGMGLTARGLVLGLAGALCLGRLLQFLFHGVDPLDPRVLGGVPALLAGIALLAAFAPARAAARVEPSVALRAE